MAAAKGKQETRNGIAHGSKVHVKNSEVQIIANR